ncbi:MAG TPA: RecX family transcriptional regulator [Tepidisphaeraceae bacterium]|jgi:regulatory protein
MPTITQITQQKKRANRRSVHLDGKFAFGCNINVVARFGLHEGMSLTAEELAAIEQGGVRQECFDQAMRFLEKRLHSRSELRTKLMRQEIGPGIIDSVLEQLVELNYLNDAAFSEARAEAAAKYKHHGRNRAMMELARKGVARETARQAVEGVYEAHDSMAIARDLARKKIPSLRRLEPLVAKRRLYGLLLRRGFDYDTIKPVVEEVLGALDDVGVDGVE